MKEIHVSDGIVPLGEFKAQAASYLKKLSNTRIPIVITQNGRPAGVLISPADYDRLYRERLLAGLEEGLADAEAGRTISTAELRERIRKWRSEDDR